MHHVEARMNLDELAKVWATGESIERLAQRFKMSQGWLKQKMADARRAGDTRFPYRGRGGSSPTSAKRAALTKVLKIDNAKCLCCQRKFCSRGPHNRLCETCRFKEPETEFSFAGISQARRRSTS